MKRPAFSSWVTFALALTFVVVLVLGVVTYHNTTVLVNTDLLLARTYHVRETVESILSSLKEAESGERGYLITGDEEYLKPFRAGSELVKAKLAALRELASDSGPQHQLLDKLDNLVAQRLAQLQAAIELRRQGDGEEGFSRVRETVRSPHGRMLMDQIHDVFAQIRREQESLLAAREQETARRSAVTHNSIIIGHALALALLLVASAVIHSDRRRRNKAEAQIREQSAVLGKVRDAIHLRNMDDTIIYWNRGCERLYGWTAEEAIGRGAADLTDAADLAGAGVPRDVTLVNESWIGELQQRTKSGREITVEQRRTLIRDDAGEPISQLIISIDITERKRTEAQQRRSQRLQSIGTLAGGIAHDLNNVLTPILMGAKLLARPQPAGKQGEIAATVEAAAQRGADMVKQLLAFAGGGEGRREIVQMPQVIEEILGILKHTMPKSIDVRVEIGEHLWPIAGDATELSQLLLNLCINARDAMPQGGRLTISAENIEVDQRRALANPDLSAGPHVTVTVADLGTGIPRDIIDKVFDPFFTTKQQGKGTGLGLATCLGIVRSHGGGINVYSEPGQGAAFTVYLPASRSDQTAVIEAQPRQLPAGQGELILLVDDEALVLEAAGATLESQGYRVLSAPGGERAVALFRQQADEIAAIIVDMMMPGMDGTATIQALREIDPRVRVIASSGLRRRAQGSCLPAGTRAFLAKPYSGAQLLITLRQVLDEPDGAAVSAAQPAVERIHDQA